MKPPEGQRTPYPSLPHDPTTEKALAGALAGFKHYGPKPDPEDFYDVALARIARAFVDHRDRIRFTGSAYIEDGDDYNFFYTYDGLEVVLANLGDGMPHRTALYAGMLAIIAPVTGDGDVRKLATFANARRRLFALEEERRELLEGNA